MNANNFGPVLPELTDELLSKLRAVYHTTPPDNGAGAARHGGLRAVYRYLQELTTPAIGADDLQPWDVLVRRRTGDELAPVTQRIEALAALALAFPGADVATARFADATTGHLLVNTLPRQVVTELASGDPVIRDLPTLNYRVIVPSGSLTHG